MDYRKTAQIFRKSDLFIIWREKEDVYWVANAYFLIRLDRKTFCKFKAKFCSYVNSPYLEELEVGEKINLDKQNNGFVETEIDFEGIMDDSRTVEARLLNVVLDSEAKGYLSIFSLRHHYVCVDKEYIDLFDESVSYKCETVNKPVFVYDSVGLAGIIMPLEYDSVKDQFADLK